MNRLPDPDSREWSEQLARGLNTLAEKAINRVMFGLGMTELMPEDVGLLKEAAKALDPKPQPDFNERIDLAELAAVLCGIPKPVDPRGDATLTKQEAP